MIWLGKRRHFVRVLSGGGAGVRGVGAGASNMWLGITVLSNVRCVDLRDGHVVLLMTSGQGRPWPWL